MTKILRIEGCVQCYHKRHTIGFPPRCAHPSVVELGSEERPAAWRAIPFWCPLEDAPDIAAVEAQRDALVAACEEAASEIEYAHSEMLSQHERNHPRGSGWARVYDKLKAAVAAAP